MPSGPHCSPGTALGAWGAPGRHGVEVGEGLGLEGVGSEEPEGCSSTGETDVMAARDREGGVGTDARGPAHERRVA